MLFYFQPEMPAGELRCFLASGVEQGTERTLTTATGSLRSQAAVPICVSPYHSMLWVFLSLP